LITKALGAAELEGANNKSSYITATTMARLFIPRHIDGRVLYVDGDTLIVGDVSPLFNIDLGGSLVAAVRDEPTAKQVVKRIQRADRMRPAALARLQAVSEITDPKTYANAGVLLFDCDDIRETPNLLEKLEDLVTASAFPMADQDHINMVLAGRIHFLNPAYNSSWGRTKEQREYISVIDGLETEQMQTSDVVVHYHGPDKPWHRVRLDLWDKRARATLSYRRQLRRYLRAFPDLAPPAKG
jgi:lipopolysaccharide biosynthesis glycosyltransferase